MILWRGVDGKVIPNGLVTGRSSRTLSSEAFAGTGTPDSTTSHYQAG